MIFIQTLKIADLNVESKSYLDDNPSHSSLFEANSFTYLLVFVPKADEKTPSYIETKKPILFEHTI